MADPRPVLKGNITISRPHGGTSNNDVIRIAIQDEMSRARFVEVEVSLADFAQAITGLAFTPATLRVDRLEVVGKNRICEQRVIECPLRTFDKDVLKQWLIENGQEEGWTLDPHLGSQTSVSCQGDKTILRYSVHKYVEANHG